MVTYNWIPQLTFPLFRRHSRNLPAYNNYGGVSHIIYGNVFRKKRSLASSGVSLSAFFFFHHGSAALFPRQIIVANSLLLVGLKKSTWHYLSQLLTSICKRRHSFCASLFHAIRESLVGCAPTRVGNATSIKTGNDRLSGNLDVNVN